MIQGKDCPTPWLSALLGTHSRGTWARQALWPKEPMPVSLFLGHRCREPQSRGEPGGEGPPAKLVELTCREERGSPVLPALAQQDVDTLVQRGPVGLVCEESQEVGSERWHLGARVTFALGREEAWMVRWADWLG